MGIVLHILINQNIRNAFDQIEASVLTKLEVQREIITQVRIAMARTNIDVIKQLYVLYPGQSTPLHFS